MVRWRGCTHHLHIGWVKTPPVRMQHTLPLLVNVQTRGNQREIDRARAQARKDKYSKGGKDDGLTPGQRKERCAGRTLPWIECVFTTGSGLCADPDGVWAVCRRRGGGNNGHAPARSPGPGSGVTPPKSDGCPGRRRFGQRPLPFPASSARCSLVQQGCQGAAGEAGQEGCCRCGQEIGDEEAAQAPIPGAGLAWQRTACPCPLP